MTKRNRLAMDISKSPETDLSGFQEQGGYIDQETIDQLEEYDRKKKEEKNLDPRTISRRKKKAREKLKADEQKKRQQTKKEMEELYEGPDEKTIRERQTEIDKIKGRLYGGPVEDAKRQDDMKQGDYIDDGTLDEKGKPNISIIKNVLKYGLPVKSTYSAVSQVGMPALKYLFLNGRF